MSGMMVRQATVTTRCSNVVRVFSSRFLEEFAVFSIMSDLNSIANMLADFLVIEWVLCSLESDDQIGC